MKVIITLMVLSLLLAGLAVTAVAQNVVDLSTLGKKPTREPVSIPTLSYSVSVPAVSTVSTSGKEVLDLSTLGKKSLKPAIQPVVLKGPTPITVTPSISIRNVNVTTTAKTVFTPAHALAGANINFLKPNVTVYTPPIAIFGGA